MEYTTVGIGVNTVAPGVVYTPLHRNTSKDVMESLLPKRRPSVGKDIVDAVMYLTDAATASGHPAHQLRGAVRRLKNDLLQERRARWSEIPPSTVLASEGLLPSGRERVPARLPAKLL
jgi:NAD(P)-dependent dehydrogenase (short-subunit alcohol dehydrogenase family)